MRENMNSLKDVCLETEQDALTVLEVDQKWKLYYNENNLNNKLIHIRAIVDNEYVVVKYWKRNQWIYEMKNIWWFIENKYLNIV